MKALFAAHDAAETDDRTAVKLLREQAAERHQLVRLLFEGCDIADAVRAVAAQHIRDKIQRITAVIRPVPCRHGLRVLKNAGGKLEIGRAQATEVQTLRLHLKQFYLFHFFSLRICKVSKMSKMSGKTVRPKPHRMP